MMKKNFIAALLLLVLFSCNESQENKNVTTTEKDSLVTKAVQGKTMKLNAGIVTSKFKETKAFYLDTLGFGVTFENEFYMLLHTPDKESEISFLLPDHPSQQPLFQKPFAGEGVYFTIEVDDVDEVYNKLKSKGVEIKIDIRNEPWGDRHFAIQDPNGVGIDIVKYSQQ